MKTKHAAIGGEQHKRENECQPGQRPFDREPPLFDLVVRDSKHEQQESSISSRLRDAAWFPKCVIAIVGVRLAIHRINMELLPLEK